MTKCLNVIGATNWTPNVRVIFEAATLFVWITLGYWETESESLLDLRVDPGRLATH
jgi:hypothetical protein